MEQGVEKRCEPNSGRDEIPEIGVRECNGMTSNAIAAAATKCFGRRL
jgi:hypothetical protein